MGALDASPTNGTRLWGVRREFEEGLVEWASQGSISTFDTQSLRLGIITERVMVACCPLWMGWYREEGEKQ